MRAFITGQFQCYPLVWMFHNRQLNQKVNKLQERVLRITYEDTESTFNDLLQRDLFTPNGLNERAADVELDIFACGTA